MWTNMYSFPRALPPFVTLSTNNTIVMLGRGGEVG
jgi:hypothetical protein